MFLYLKKSYFLTRIRAILGLGGDKTDRDKEEKEKGAENEGKSGDEEILTVFTERSSFVSETLTMVFLKWKMGSEVKHTRS